MMNIAFPYLKNQKYLIAVSGGPDSVFLLHQLYLQGFSLVVCHVNYHHRDEADQEEKLVKFLANKYNFPFEKEDAYYDEKGNFENWAREIRYKFFKKIKDKYQIDACFVGHHQDDLLETYLMQRKRGYVSYFGLKERVCIKGVNIIRPLLKLSKNDIIQYLSNNNLPYAIDKTNYDLDLTRNKIRHVILKNMTEIEKENLLDEINKKNQVLNEVNDKLAKLMKEEIKITDLLKLTEEEFDRFIFTYINKCDEDVVLSKKRINDIKSSFKKEGNQLIKINNQFNLLKEYDSLKIVKNEMHNYMIVVPSPRIVENEFIYFDLISNPRLFYIKEDSYPLTITNVNLKDKVRIGKIHKSVNRLLIDEKIPYLKRLHWPKIVNNKGEIIFIPRRCENEDGLFIVK